MSVTQRGLRDADAGGLQQEAPATAIELSIVLPCLNEAGTLGACIEAARSALQRLAIEGEVVVADNGSSDGSIQIAERLGARVVPVAEKGYGAALLGGIAAARGRFVIMGDADATYDFEAIEPFVERLRAGYDLVMGNRFAGGIADGAMPWKNRWIGNPVLTGLGRLFFRSPVADFHCGLRGFRRDAILELDLQTTGMEFASEMVVKATLNELAVTEVPTTLSRGDERTGLEPPAVARRLAAPPVPARVQPELALPVSGARPDGARRRRDGLVAPRAAGRGCGSRSTCRPCCSRA